MDSPAFLLIRGSHIDGLELFIFKLDAHALGAQPCMKTVGLGRSLTPTHLSSEPVSQGPGCFARRLRTGRPERLRLYSS